MEQNQQQEFVNELLDRSDQVSGIWLTLNKFLILFMKCLYIRKRKKIITFFEFLIPVLVFFFAIRMQDNYFDFRSFTPQNVPNEKENVKFINHQYSSLASLESPKPLYYDYNQTNVNGASLEEFLTDALKETRKVRWVLVF